MILNREIDNRDLLLLRDRMIIEGYINKRRAE
jgi:hypothetical protein